MKRSLTIALFAILTSVLSLTPVHADSHDGTKQQALVILTSGSLQTQGMAMVLSNAIQEQGADLEILLCDEAGDLALKTTTNQRLQPRDVSPEMIMVNLMNNGASVNVCALYLPNSEHTEADLRDGIGQAMPPAIGAKMLDTSVRVFSF